MSRSALAGCGLTLLALANPLLGADFYVATNGSDGAAGTLGAPFATIQHGVDQLAVGDTLYVRGGRYHEGVSINGLIGVGSPWSGGVGWTGDWSLGVNTTSALWAGNTSAHMVKDGSITRTLATGVSGSALTFKWDIDSFESGDTAFAEIFDGGWQTVWSGTQSSEGGDDSSNPDNLQTATIPLGAYGTVTQVRFRLGANGTSDRFFVDDVQIGAASHDFEPAESVTITIRSFPGEEVTVDGTEAITTGWSLHAGNIYKTTLTDDVWQLFVDDEMITSARWPNAEAWTDDMWDQENTWGRQDITSTNGILVDDGTRDLAGTGTDFTGAIAILNVGSWLSFARTVNSHGAGSDTFTYDPIPSGYHSKIQNGRYFLEGAMACLDTNKEWYYNPSSQELFLIADDGLSPAGRDIRGKTLTYGIEILNSQNLQVQGIDFFACTFNVQSSSEITVQDCNVLFPSYSKRMLSDLAKAEPTTMDGTDNVLRNCTFRYADGSGLVFTGDNGLIENCLFEQIDYSCVGSLHDVMVNIRDASYLTFRHNTLDTGGNSVGVKAGSASLIEFNRVTRQGNLQNDGAAIQADHNFTDGTVMRHNWIHDNVKFGLRFDSPWLQPSIYGTNGTMNYNVIWNARNIIPKGDYHTVYGNTGFDNGDFDISLFSDVTHGGINSNTVARNNAVHAISGNNASGITPYAGIVSHNWVGVEFDPDRVIQDQLADPAMWDFRSAAGSELIDAGTNVVGVVTNFIGTAPDIGAYEYGDAHYWMPGYRTASTSIPIPNVGVTNQPEGRELIYLLGYKGVRANVYFGTDSNSLPLLVSSPASTNVIDPRDHGVVPDGNTTYYWRVDTVLADSNVVTGSVWHYGTGDYLVGTPSTLFSDDFEAYTAGASPPSSNWAHQVTLGAGTILVFDMGGNNTVRLLNTTTDDRTVLSATDAIAGQGVITLSFDSYHDAGTPVSGPLVSAGVGRIDNGNNQVRRVNLTTHVTPGAWHHFDWIVNQSGAVVNYSADGAGHSVAPCSADLWRGGVLVVDNGTDKPSNTLTDTNLMDSFGWTINKANTGDCRIDNVVVRDSPFVFVPSTPFEVWAAGYGVLGQLNDPDGDGLDNLREFGLGGIPTNALSQGYAPTYRLDESVLLYVYPRRKNSGLDYFLETNADLLSGSWTNGGYTELPTAGIIDPDFEAVTNQVPAVQPSGFARLRIEEL